MLSWEAGEPRCRLTTIPEVDRRAFPVILHGVPSLPCCYRTTTTNVVPDMQPALIMFR